MKKKTFLIGVGVLGGILLFMDARYKHEHPYQTTDTFDRHRHAMIQDGNLRYSAQPYIQPNPTSTATPLSGAWY